MHPLYKKHIKNGTAVVKLIAINVAIFIVIAIVQVSFGLMKFEGGDAIQNFLGLSSKWSFLYRAWTPLTYMFVQANFLHLLFNMLILYFSGNMFLFFFKPKQLVSVYILGGLSGALIYMIAFSVIPLYSSLGNSILIGASASVMAILFGLAGYRPNIEVRLFGILPLKLVYLAIAIFVIDFLNLLSSNAGGHVAHIGGAIFGYAFGTFMLRGTDITRWLYKIFDNIAALTKRKPSSKIKEGNTFKNREEAYRANLKKKLREEELDTILDKIKESGYNSLSKDEKRKLFDSSNN